jgi:hypothetical protein
MHFPVAFHHFPLQQQHHCHLLLKVAKLRLLREAATKAIIVHYAFLYFAVDAPRTTIPCKLQQFLIEMLLWWHVVTPTHSCMLHVLFQQV